MSNRRIIGFDRKIKLEWLDAVASKVADGESPTAIRAWLNMFLKDQLGGNGHGCNRCKTITVLSRIWSNVPMSCRGIRNRAIKLLQQVDSEERLAIHWSMATAVYPFFRDVTMAVGRQLSLQGDVQRYVVLKRLAESWGDRPAVHRAGSAIWSSFVSWGVMNETKHRGRYTPLNRQYPVSMATTGLLIEASVRSSKYISLPITAIKSLPGLFPFALNDVAASLHASGQVTITRQGSNLEMLQLTEQASSG